MEPAVRVGDHVYADMTYYRSSKPARGDLAIFSPPKTPHRMMIMRIVGLEGEEIEIRDKVVYINGQRLADPWGYHNDPEIIPRSAGKMSVRDNLSSLEIPAGTVFVVGDNRDASLDSRYLGPVSALHGRLLYVYWATDKSRIGTSFR